MKNFLSIGEVVKMKGVTHRALRHYDELGILKPAYINPDTKYRYYAKSQMIILDIVMLCAPLGIPLQSFKNYITEEGSINAKQMIGDAKIKALEKQIEIEQKLYFLDTALAHFADVQNIIDKTQIYTKKIAKRYFFTIDSSQYGGSHTDYWTNITTLYNKIFKSGMTMSIDQGVCFYVENNIAQVKYFVEVKEPTIQHPDILIIPEAVFLCEFFDDARYNEAIEKYQAHDCYLAGNLLILSDIFEENISDKAAPFEVQLML